MGALSGFLITGATHAQSFPQPSTSPSRAPVPSIPALTPSQFVTAVESLETQPLSAQSTALRLVLLLWYHQSPAVNVSVCLKEAPLMGEDTLSHVLLSQMQLEDAAEQIRHPGISPQESQTVGMLSMLRLYQTLRLRGLNTSNPYVDTLQRELSQKGVPGLIPHTCSGQAAGGNGVEIPTH